MELIYYFLPAIILLGIITSYEDLKFGKIRNRYVISSLFYALIVNMIIMGYFALNKGWINYSYLIGWVTGILFALILGFMLWYNKFWTAGDAKLYMAYSALVPLSAYNFGYIKYANSLVILINTFVPLALFYFIKIMFKTSFNEKITTLRDLLQIKPLFNYVVFIFVILWLPILLSPIGMGINFVEIMVLTMSLSFFLRKFFKKNVVVVMTIIGIIRLILDRGVYTVEFLVQFSTLFLILIVFKTFFVELGKVVFCDKIKINELQKGMVLLSQIYKKKGKYEIEQDKNKFKKEIDELSNEKKSYLFKQRGEGLNGKNVIKIKKLYKEGKFTSSTVQINKITPFAHYMFIGVLLTIFLRGNIFSTIMSIDLFLKEFYSITINLFILGIILVLLTLQIYLTLIKWTKKVNRE
jgi:hypothetical protein